MQRHSENDTHLTRYIFWSNAPIRLYSQIFAIFFRNFGKKYFIEFKKNVLLLQINQNIKKNI